VRFHHSHLRSGGRVCGSQTPVVCAGFAVRADSVGILFVKTVGIQGMGHYQSLELEGWDRNFNQALKIAIPSDDVQQSEED
jgi:hypothetical protein